MKRIVVALTVSALAAAGAGVASAQPGNGNGAVKSGLAPVSGLAPLGCQAARQTDPQTAHGFVVLNAPGKPAKGNGAGPSRKLVGEVALKNAKPGAYEVALAGGSGCGERLGTLVVNEQGNGNLAFEVAGKGAGVWNVVLTQPLVTGLSVAPQSFASAPVTLK